MHNVEGGQCGSPLQELNLQRVQHFACILSLDLFNFQLFGQSTHYKNSSLLNLLSAGWQFQFYLRALLDNQCVFVRW